jgi:hypothetical protein
MNTDTEPGRTDRYRYIQYNDDGGTVTVIQDTENHHAWIQSTLHVAVEQ